MDAGMAPARGLVSFRVCLVIPRTLEAHVCEVELAELRERRDVVRDRATELVAAEAELLERWCERREQTQRLGRMDISHNALQLSFLYGAPMPQIPPRAGSRYPTTPTQSPYENTSKRRRNTATPPLVLYLLPSPSRNAATPPLVLYLLLPHVAHPIAL